MRPESVLITGTTSGLGRALLGHYARLGSKVISVNRRRSSELETLYPNVRFECVDVRSREQVRQLIARLVESAELPEVLLLNAGINRVDNDASFDLDAYRDVIDTNLYGVLHFVAPVSELARGPKTHHVIAVSSMAAHVGNPYALGYHTSKLALSGCFRAWSRMYAGTHLVFQQVLLGPVPTGMYSMADRLPSWMGWFRDSFSGSLEGSVRAITRFAESRRATLVHPWRAVPLFLTMRVGQALVPGFFQGRRTLDGKSRRRGQPEREG